MKKLMIAAALVAMIGAAEATTYKFSATLKTTSEKQGQQGKTTTQSYGYDAGGSEYWHQNAAFTDPSNDPYFGGLVKTTTKKRGSQSYQVQTIRQADVNKLTVEEQTQLQTILSTYNSKDPNGDWCLSLYFATPAICYRVPKTKKYTAELTQTGCCDDASDIDGAYVAGKSFLDLFVGQVTCSTDKSEIGTAQDPLSDTAAFNWVFGYRINGQNGAKSKTIEACAKMDWNNDIASWDYGVVANDFALAGQGTFDTTRMVIKSFTGKIVGALAAPVCGCCDQEKESHVYTCNGFVASDYGTDGYTRPNNLTAAYGDFSIVFKSL